MQFKIDCIFWKNQDGGHLINDVNNISTLTAVLDGMLDALFFIQSH